MVIIDSLVLLLFQFYERLSVTGVLNWLMVHWYLVVLAIGISVFSVLNSPHQPRQYGREQEPRSLFVKILSFLFKLLILAVGIIVLIVLYMTFSSRF